MLEDRGARGRINQRIKSLQFYSVNLYQQQPVFLSSLFFSMFDVLHIVINSVYVQNLPTEQATSVVTDFLVGL